MHILPHVIHLSTRIFARSFLSVASRSLISLCLDQDTKLWNGDEKWIEVDKVTAADGAGSYAFDPGKFLPGTYYIGGYVYSDTSRNMDEITRRRWW